MPGNQRAKFSLAAANDSQLYCMQKSCITHCSTHHGAIVQEGESLREQPRSIEKTGRKWYIELNSKAAPKNEYRRQEETAL